MSASPKIPMMPEPYHVYHAQAYLLKGKLDTRSSSLSRNMGRLFWRIPAAKA